MARGCSAVSARLGGAGIGPVCDIRSDGMPGRGPGVTGGWSVRGRCFGIGPVGGPALPFAAPGGVAGRERVARCECRGGEGSSGA
jgi:hypothetical protein